MSPQIISYLRNSKRQKVGLLLAEKDLAAPDTVRFGWSILHKNDEFNREFGLILAKERLKNNTPIPIRLGPDISKFVNRAAKYFKCSVWSPIEKSEKL